MNPGTNTCIAYVAARLVSGAPAMRILDVADGTWSRIGGIVDQERVALYDYERHGPLNGKLPLLEDNCAGILIHMTLDGPDFVARAVFLGKEIRGRVDGLEVDLIDSQSRVKRYRLEALGSS